jgi:hypothetical protein
VGRTPPLRPKRGPQHRRGCVASAPPSLPAALPSPPDLLVREFYHRERAARPTGNSSCCSSWVYAATPWVVGLTCSPPRIVGRMPVQTERRSQAPIVKLIAFHTIISAAGAAA